MVGKRGLGQLGLLVAWAWAKVAWVTYSMAVTCWYVLEWRGRYPPMTIAYTIGYYIGYGREGASQYRFLTADGLAGAVETPNFLSRSFACVASTERGYREISEFNSWTPAFCMPQARPPMPAA